ncbi:MAG: amidohydrolase [Selenomonadaceae bacterium]|nr:amidohydrolase [Selenomonadaceae bacterium]
METTRLEPFIIDTFKELHSCPELSYEEFGTTAKIKSILQKENIEVLDLPLKTGLVAKIGNEESPVVALRADIDALPIDEETNLPYASKTPGKMHACGHDFHTAALLGAALSLKSTEDKLKGGVLLVFQPAEEDAGGALKIVGTNALKDAKVIYGLHTSPLYPVGTLGISPGPVMAAVDRFTVTFVGKGCHAAHPDEGADVIPLVSEFVLALQTIVSRNSNPFAANLVSVTKVSAGNTWNVLPETAEIEGTVRTLTIEDRKMIKSRFYALAEGLAAAFGAKVKIDWWDGPPPTINDVLWTNFVEHIAEKEGFIVEAATPSLGGEDFSEYQAKIPGVYIKVGTGETYPHHTSKFVADPAALLPAANLLAHLARETLRGIK